MELISAKEAIKEILDAYEYEYPTASGAFDHFVTTVIPNILNNAPTVDAEPVKHGRWVPRKEIFSERDGEVDAIGCSECGKSQRAYRRTPYCPNCGAKMDAEVE